MKKAYVDDRLSGIKGSTIDLTTDTTIPVKWT